MIDIINNKDKLLGDDLKNEIRKDSKVKIVASCFSIYAFDALKDELKGLDELKFIFSSPTFIEEKVADKIKKEKREFYIPHELRESSLYGTQFEVRLRNKLTQKAIARECAEWIRNKVKLEDVTERIVDYIASAYNENPPEYTYFIILYNIFSEFLADISEDYMPNELTGFKDSLIWYKLYNYQRDGVVGIINKLEKYNGCILADSVGLGKTFTALAVMHYYDLKNKSILVLCPKKLSSNWNSYKGNTRKNIFFKDKIRTRRGAYASCRYEPHYLRWDEHGNIYP